MNILKCLFLLLIISLSSAQRLDLDSLRDSNGNALALGLGSQEFDLGNNCFLTLELSILFNPAGFTETNTEASAYDWEYEYNSGNGTVMQLIGFINGIADITLTNQGLNSDSYNRFEGSYVQADSSITPSYASGDGTPVFVAGSAPNTVSHYTLRPPPEIMQIGPEDTVITAVTETSSANFDFRGGSFLARTGYGDDDILIDDGNDGITPPDNYVLPTANLTDSWSITIQNHVIPEPSSILLLGLSGIGLLARRRR